MLSTVTLQELAVCREFTNLTVPKISSGPGMALPEVLASHIVPLVPTVVVPPEIFAVRLPTAVTVPLLMVPVTNPLLPKRLGLLGG